MSQSAFIEALRNQALRYPEAVAGIACAGTALEKTTVKARDKAFLFLGAADAMVKLGPSLAEATELATWEPERFKVGAHGWVTATFQDGSPLPEVLERWIDESYRLVAPKALVAKLPAPQ